MNYREIIDERTKGMYETVLENSNEIVMEKLMRTKCIKMYEEDEDILEDAIIENRQAIEMGTIYRDILSLTDFFYIFIEYLNTIANKSLYS